MASTGAGMRSLSSLVQKDWFLVILVILLVIESSLLILLVVESYFGTQDFPQFSLVPYVQPQCRTLAATIFAQTNTNRTVVFDCPGMSSAFKVPSYEVAHDILPVTAAVVPIFSLPRAYLSLALRVGLGTLPLESGKTVVLGIGFQIDYDYVAVINNTATRPNGFSITWRSGSFPNPVKVTANPGRLSITPGQSASTSVTVTSLGGFSGNVSLDYGLNSCTTYCWPNGIVISLNPTLVFLSPGGSASATLNFAANSTAPAATYDFYVTAAPVPASPQTGGGSTSLQVIVG